MQDLPCWGNTAREISRDTVFWFSAVKKSWSVGMPKPFYWPSFMAVLLEKSSSAADWVTEEWKCRHSYSGLGSRRLDDHYINSFLLSYCIFSLLTQLRILLSIGLIYQMEVVVCFFFFNSLKTDICKPRVYYDDFTVSVNIVAKRRNTFLCGYYRNMKTSIFQVITYLLPPVLSFSK